MGKRVLAVDDDAMMLAVIRNTLRNAEYEVTCAASGREAIDRLKMEKYDCIVLDFYMPDNDGLDVVGFMYSKRIRIPVIIFSSNIEAYHEAGVQAFGVVKEILKKPSSVSELLQTVERVIREEEGV